MKVNKEKCQLLISGHKYENVRVKTGDEKIWESEKQKLLRIEMEEMLILMIMWFHYV